MLTIGVVADPQQLTELHQAADGAIGPAIQCSPESFPQPLLDSLLYYGDVEPHLDVVVGWDGAGAPAAYVVIDSKTGHVGWLVLIGDANATVEVVTEMCQWCRVTYGACYGVVENATVRALHEQGGATITGNRVAW